MKKRATTEDVRSTTRGGGGGGGDLAGGAAGAWANAEPPVRVGAGDDGGGGTMELLCAYANRPGAFFLRYVRLRPVSHSLILAAVLAPVICPGSTQYRVNFLVDPLSRRGGGAENIWPSF